MSVESNLRDQCDHLAKAAYDLSKYATHSPSLWSTVDEVADEDLENAIKGSLISLIDDYLDAPEYLLKDLIARWAWSVLSYAISKEMTYTYNAVESAVESFDDILNAYRWRIAHHLAKLLPEYPATVNVFWHYVALTLGHVTYGSSFVAGSSLDTDYVQQVRVEFLNTVQIGAVNDFVLVPTMEFACGNNLTPTLTITKGTAINTSTRPGEANLRDSAASGQKDIPITDALQPWVLADATNYANCVLLSTSTGTVHEIVRVKAVSGSSGSYKIEALDNLRNSWTTSDLVRVLYAGVSGCTISNGNSGDDVDIKTYPDRAPAY